MKIDQVAVQMYTLREHAAEDLDGTLWRLSDIGYRQVEFAGLYDNTAEDVASMLERHGMTAPAAHIQYARFESEFDGVVSDAQALGMEWVIVPALPERQIDESLAQEYITKLNSFGLLADEAGLKFAYHNHAFEFENTYDDGTTFFDRLVAGTDADKVKLELDAFWVVQGGADPAKLLRDLGDRVRLVHIKDAGREDPASDVPFGEGSLDWDAILGAADAAGVAWYVVEQDNPGDAFEDVTVALRNAEKWSAK
jgi:sugar phosphate isomerase/epimerase